MALTALFATFLCLVVFPLASSWRKPGDNRPNFVIYFPDGEKNNDKTIESYLRRIAASLQRLEPKVWAATDIRLSRRPISIVSQLRERSFLRPTCSILNALRPDAPSRRADTCTFSVTERRLISCRRTNPTCSSISKMLDTR